MLRVQRRCWQYPVIRPGGAWNERVVLLAEESSKGVSGVGHRELHGSLEVYRVCVTGHGQMKEAFDRVSQALAGEPLTLYGGGNHTPRMANMDAEEMRATFRHLHDADELFVMPNPWDIGSAMALEHLGFGALATTSSGHAASLGRNDGEVTQQELVEHVRALTDAVDVPLNVDSERCFGGDAEGIRETIRLLAEAGASGCSIEDWEPETATIDPLDVAVDRVAAAADAANEFGLVLTARAENHFRGVGDLDDTITRLSAFRDVGAGCLFAPALTSPVDIERVVREVGAPINILLMQEGPSIAELADLGVRRVSTGGALAKATYATLEARISVLDGAAGGMTD